jgi:hypothetical protein
MNFIFSLHAQKLSIFNLYFIFASVLLFESLYPEFSGKKYMLLFLLGLHNYIPCIIMMLALIVKFFYNIESLN